MWDFSEEFYNKKHPLHPTKKYCKDLSVSHVNKFTRFQPLQVAQRMKEVKELNESSNRLERRRVATEADF